MFILIVKAVVHRKYEGPAYQLEASALTTELPRFTVSTLMSTIGSCQVFPLKLNSGYKIVARTGINYIYSYYLKSKHSVTPPSMETVILADFKNINDTGNKLTFCYCDIVLELHDLCFYDLLGGLLNQKSLMNDV